MILNYTYAIISVIVVSLISLVVATPFFFKKEISNKTLLLLLSLSVGVLLGTVFFGFLPEIYHGIEEHHHEIEKQNQFEESINLEKTINLNDYHNEEEEKINTIIASILILIGFMLMFIIEKFIHYHHKKGCENKHLGHSHAYNIAPINLIGDGIHNFIDGLIIAGSYILSIPTGIAATISIIFHEIPQEISDFGILIYSGYSKKKALFFNFIFATTAILGTIIGLILNEFISGFVSFMIPIAAGNFLYIASSNLVPQIHKHCNLKESILHILAIIIGILIIIIITLLFPHSH
jgi:zinc and cadmium transporter